MALHVRRLGVAALGIALALTGSGLGASESPVQAFARNWEGKNVVARQSLYTLVYNERGRLGNSRGARRDGLTVVTPFEGVFFQFDGRQGRDDVTERDPQRVLKAVAETYQGDSLDVRAYQRIEPLLLTRYDAGVDFIVRDVRVDRHTIRLSLAQVAGPDLTDEPVTSLTIKWPAPLSKSFSERTLVENLIRRFVDLKPAP